MKLTMTVITCLLLTGFCGSLYASDTTDCEDWGKMGGYGVKYDVNTVVTISGEIDAVRKIALGKRVVGRFCYAIDIDDGEKIHTIYLGPGSFIKQKGFVFSPGTKVTVIGSSVTIDGRPLVLAKEVNDGGRVLHLRDDKGKHL
ncbi:MAG: DNA-binding protein [Deltaproteobacteria bacterium HGW-Deltaproteobacteria-4]|nr:MAG: DNA-binding protein [Deltaproteobacteria bacterium HGW-Deltaproteobacteria-4]